MKIEEKKEEPKPVKMSVDDTKIVKLNTQILELPEKESPEKKP